MLAQTGLLPGAQDLEALPVFMKPRHAQAKAMPSELERGPLQGQDMGMNMFRCLLPSVRDKTHAIMLHAGDHAEVLTQRRHYGQLAASAGDLIAGSCKIA